MSMGTISSSSNSETMSINNSTRLVDTIRVLRKQEDQVYYRRDQHDVYQSTSFSPAHPQHVDMECRVKMAEWMMQVVDFCDFQRETVSIALNYMDRYLVSSNNNVQQDRKVFQLASMTCLYTAVKTHEPEAMEPKTISGLSQGAYSVKDVEAMEMSICMNLGWYLNPPTAKTLLSYLMQLLEEADHSLTPEQVEELGYQVELASSYLVNVKPSTLAFCALANAGGLNDDSLKMIIRTANIDMKEAIGTQDALWELLRQVREQQGGEEIIAILPRNGSLRLTNDKSHPKAQNGFTKRSSSSRKTTRRSKTGTKRSHSSTSVSPRCVSSR